MLRLDQDRWGRRTVTNRAATPGDPKDASGAAWDEPFASTDPDELLDALTDGRLWLCNAEISFGALSGLEEVCQSPGLGYTQHVEAGIGDDASVAAPSALLTDWRPGM